MTDIGTLIAVGSTVAGAIAYYGILILQGEALIGKITSIDQWLAGGLAASVVLFVLKWAFKKNDSLSKRIDDLHDQMLESQTRYHEKIEALLRKDKE